MVSTVASLSVGADGVVTAAAEQAGTIVITGTLSSPLAAGDSVQIVLPSGEVRSATVNQDGTSFSTTVTGLQAPQFGAGGTISAYVMDAAGAQSATFSAAFYAASLRTILPITATPGAPLTSTAAALSLSQDGSTVAFEAAPVGSSTLQRGVYVENLATGVVTLVAANATAPSLSPDGHSITYVARDAFEQQVWLKNLDTGAVTLLSAPPGSNGSTGGSGNSLQPHIAADGTVVFTSYATNLISGINTYGQVIAARVSGGIVSLSLVSTPDLTAPDAGAAAAGASSFVNISADGSTAVFLSGARDLLGAGDPHAGALDGSLQVYVRALRDNPVTGQRAGTVTLVSGLPGGAIAHGVNDAPAISANGRYVVFSSDATNLVSGLQFGAGITEIYLADLVTGAITLVSASAAGVAANVGATGAQISADGRTVVFQTYANLLPGTDPTALNVFNAAQTYAKDTVTGAVTLLSAAGYTPADAASLAASLSGDGATVVFSSLADNLVPGGGPHVSYSTPRSYLTAVPTTPRLTITQPGAAASDTITLTGTIDAADAARPIVLTDAADPGFTATPVVTTASADPLTDTWSSTVTFTGQGAQTVTAATPNTAAAVSATFSVSFTPTVTLSAPTGPVTVDPLSGAATTFTGTAAGAAGQSVSLFLRAANNTLLPLASATVGATGAWSIAVPDSLLAANGSGADAVVAQVPGATGKISGASAAFNPAVTLFPTLYDYKFTFADGSFYTGTVADDGSLGYAAGKTIKTAAGQYVILGAAGLTTQASGAVTIATYYDTSTAATYTPSGGGAAGLGSESGTITGPSGVVAFGNGLVGARPATNTAYDFTFIYNDGSAYSGTVAGNVPAAYTPGQTITSSAGAYHITGIAGATADAVGTVRTTVYYDSQTKQNLPTTLSSQGLSSGLNGLGSETDSVSGVGVSTAFGQAGLAKVALRFTQTFLFQYVYADGSVYYGFVTDDGSYGYYVGDHIYGSRGAYYVYGTETPVLGQVGDVYVLSYHDATANEDFTPYLTSKGEAAGVQGLGSEVDITTGDSGNQIFGTSAHLEAKQDPFRIYQFIFTYQDDSYYTGGVVDDGSDGYFVGQTITTPYGYYRIQNYLSATGKGLVGNQVFDVKYFDVTSYEFYTPDSQATGAATGTSGLGSELDTITGAPGKLQFGRGGQFEAKEAPNSGFDFTFYYKDGSFYYGKVADNGSYHYFTGEQIKTPYGYYQIDGPIYTTDQSGIVRATTYHDVSDNTDYVPKYYFQGLADGGAGLGTEIDYITGPSGTQEFGIGGLYEAKQAPNVLLAFDFFYPDGSYYYGTVVENGGASDHQTITTPYGYYDIFGSVEGTALPVGLISVAEYYDSTTKTTYAPFFYSKSPPAADGGSGLGSEDDAVVSGAVVADFGLGGKLEAKLSTVTAYSFAFRYTDGSFYSGTVAASALTSYLGQLVTAGQTINTPYGYYYISGATPQSSLTAGIIQVSSYFSTITGKFYTPIHYGEGKAAGAGGLGSELDQVVGLGSLSSFGYGGQIEARPNTFVLATAAVHYAFDGPLSGAAVGYLNPLTPGKIQIDPTQPTATTDGEGRYVLSPGTGPIVITGGTDTATGLPFHGVLEQAGSGVALSPLTTLIEAVATAEGDTSDNGVAHAGSVVAAALGLPTGLDLANYLPTDVLNDPDSAHQDIANAEAVYRAGAGLLDIETLIDAGGGSSQAAIATAATALANGSLTTLSSLATLAQYGGMSAPDELAARLMFTVADNYLTGQLLGITEPTLITGLIAGAGIALQRDAANSLQAAGQSAGSDTANAFADQLPTTLATDDQLALTDGVACYCHGVAILTEQGSLPVESLAVGMRIVTWDGSVQPIRWIGRRSYAGRFLAGRRHLLPVLFQAGCLGGGLPHRDLRVSPLHALFLDGLLIPAIHLVNGTTIRQEETATRVDYVHVELDRHNVIFAEGAAAETFLDDDSRGMFHNAAEFRALYPDADAPKTSFAPRVTDGFELEWIRRTLKAKLAPASF